MSEHEHVSLDEMLKTAAVAQAQARAARARSTTSLLSFLGLVALMTAPAFVIYVWVALWQWLQR